MKKTLLIALGAILLIAIIGGTVWAVYQSRQHSPSPTSTAIWDPAPKQTKTSARKQNSLSRQYSDGKCEGEGTKPLTHSPMNLNDVAIILPYGLVIGAHVTPIDHMYFSPLDFNSPRDTYPVYAVADGYIVEIAHRGEAVEASQQGKLKSEFRLFIEHSCTFYTYGDLITSLTPDIAAQVSSDRSQSWTKRVRIPITAGQEIGRIGGQTLDWGVYNADVTLSGFITPDLYKHEPWKIHTDPKSFDYFPQELRNQLYTKVARKVEPRIGKIDYDIDGKLIGNWFREGTNGYAGKSQQGYWDGHLSIAPDYIDPTQIRVSLGNFNGDAKQFGAKGNTPDPASIGIDSGLTKYELQSYIYYNKDTGRDWMPHDGPVSNPAAKNNGPVQGTVLFQLLENRKLKVEVFPGKSASQVTDFTSAAQIYVR